MATFCTVFLVLPLLMLSAIEGHNAENKAPVTTELNSMNWTRQCEKYSNLPQINQKVETFNRDNDWNKLKTELKALLDQSSQEYIQLQNTTDLSSIGFRGHIQLATLLMCAGMHANKTSGVIEQTMLHGAAMYGQLQLVKLLLDRGANVNAKNKHGVTPLALAAYTGELEAIKLLVQAGADTAIRDNSEYTALDWARITNKTETVKYLENLPH